MCENCKSLVACHTHMCPTAALEIQAEATRAKQTLRLPTDASARTHRTTPRMPSTFTLLDAAGKQ